MPLFLGRNAACAHVGKPLYSSCLFLSRTLRLLFLSTTHGILNIKRKWDPTRWISLSPEPAGQCQHTPFYRFCISVPPPSGCVLGQTWILITLTRIPASSKALCLQPLLKSSRWSATVVKPVNPSIGKGGWRHWRAALKGLVQYLHPSPWSL